MCVCVYAFAFLNVFMYSELRFFNVLFSPHSIYWRFYNLFNICYILWVSCVVFMVVRRLLFVSHANFTLVVLDNVIMFIIGLFISPISSFCCTPAQSCPRARYQLTSSLQASRPCVTSIKKFCFFMVPNLSRHKRNSLEQQRWLNWL